MAQLDMSEWESLEISLKELADMPQEVVDRVLTAQAEVVARAQRTEAMKLGMGYEPNNNERHTSYKNHLGGQKRNWSTGQTARAVTVGKPKSKRAGRSVSVYFRGNREKRTPNSKPIPTKEVAFLNEYGSRNINQRNFIAKANDASADEALQAAAKVYDEFAKSKGL